MPSLLTRADNRAPFWPRGSSPSAADRSAHRCGGRNDRCRKVGRCHQVSINRSGSAPTLGDRPDDQALAATHVTGDEHAVDIGGPAVVAGDIASVGQIDPNCSTRAFCSGPVKPIARNTIWAGKCCSLPSTG